MDAMSAGPLAWVARLLLAAPLATLFISVGLLASHLRIEGLRPGPRVLFESALALLRPRLAHSRLVASGTLIGLVTVIVSFCTGFAPPTWLTTIGGFQLVWLLVYLRHKPAAWRLPVAVRTAWTGAGVGLAVELAVAAVAIHPSEALQPAAAALVGCGAGLGVAAWRTYRNGALAGRWRTPAAVLGVVGLVAGVAATAAGVLMPAWVAVAGPVVLAAGALSLWAECHGPARTRPGRFALAYAALPSGVAGCAALYVWGGVYRQIIPEVVPHSLAGMLTPIASVSFSIVALLTVPLRRWDARSLSAVVGWATAALMAFAGVLQWLVPGGLLLWGMLALASAGAAAGGVSYAVIPPFLAAWRSRHEGKEVGKTNSAFTYLWGTTVGLVFVAVGWLAPPQRLGWGGSLLIVAALLALSTPFLRLLPRDERERSRQPVGTILRATLRPLLDPRADPRALLGSLCSLFAGAQTSVFYASFELVYRVWHVTGFTTWVGWAFLGAMALIFVLEVMLRDRAMMWMGALVMTLPFASAVVFALVNAANGLLWHRIGGWTLVFLCLAVELGTTAQTAKVWGLLDWRNPERTAVLQMVCKYGLGGFLAMPEPLIVGWSGSHGDVAMFAYAGLIGLADMIVTRWASRHLQPLAGTSGTATDTR